MLGFHYLIVTIFFTLILPPPVISVLHATLVWPHPRASTLCHSCYGTAKYTRSSIQFPLLTPIPSHNCFPIAPLLLPYCYYFSISSLFLHSCSSSSNSDILTNFTPALMTRESVGRLPVHYSLHSSLHPALFCSVYYSTGHKLPWILPLIN